VRLNCGITMPLIGLGTYSFPNDRNTTELAVHNALEVLKHMCVYIYIHTHIRTKYMYIYIFIVPCGTNPFGLWLGIFSFFQFSVSYFTCLLLDKGRKT